jgi:hypothetical protein
VATGTAVSVTFSEPMDKASAQAAFSLARASDSAAVTGSFSWSGSTMTFQPAATLAGGIDYRATVAAGARDLAGNQLQTSRAWSFRTLSTATFLPSATVIESSSWRSGSVSSLHADDNVFFDVNSTASWTRTSSWYARFTGIARDLQSLRVTYRGRSSASCSQTVAVWRWSTASWVTVDTRTIGWTEVLVDRTLTGALSDLVSSTDEARVRVRCTSGTQAFYAGGDLLRLTVS